MSGTVEHHSEQGLPGSEDQKLCVLPHMWTLFFYYSFIHMCVHCLGHFSPQHLPPHFQAAPVLPLSLILLKTRHKHNKEDKVFLLVKDSYTERFLALLSCTNVLQLTLIHL
jgi:hypothetical protein